MDGTTVVLEVQPNQAGNNLQAMKDVYNFTKYRPQLAFMGITGATDHIIVFWDDSAGSTGVKWIWP